jgi:hypothetical protein
MSALERKAAFVYAVTLDNWTLKDASQRICGVTWHHLREGIAGLRPLGAETQEKFAAYIGRPVHEVFGSAEPAPANAA